jgi:hypothetical protein
VKRPIINEARLTTPRAAAVAGIIFAILFGTSLVLIRLAIPQDQSITTPNLQDKFGLVKVALILIPYAGIAFLWFVGVVRDHLGNLEDRFFSTVFFGSSLLFLAMIFTASALSGAIIESNVVAANIDPDTGIFTFGREFAYRLINIYAMRMAGVFMISLGTIWFRTRRLPQWMAIFTLILALIMLFGLGRDLWVTLFFPVWVMVVSIYILVRNRRSLPEPVLDG